MTLTQLRKLLSDIEIEDDPYCIGYWSRWAGLERPARSAEQRAGYDQADREIADDCAWGSIVVGASEPVGQA